MMDIYTIGQKLKIYFAKKIHFGFRASFQEQMNYFSKLKDAENDFKRSYYQYRCRCFLETGIIYKIIRILGNIMSCFVLFGVLFRKYKKPYSKEEYGAFFNENEKRQNLLPLSLVEEFGSISFSDNNHKQYLGKFEKRYIFNIWKKKPFEFTFVLKNALKIGFYNYIINKKNISAIITTSEYSYTSSILTNYCEKKGILHINVQHGEATKSLSRCYFRFSRCYVWDDYYIDLFKKMRAKEDQFIIEIPSSIFFDNISTKKTTKYKYFLSEETEIEMNLIKSNLDKIGSSYIVRPHPIWTKKDLVLKIFGEEIVEDPKKIKIEDSIMTTKVVIARKSTVLFQAYYNNISLVIDDITKPNEYREMLESEYIMTLKPHKLMSKLIEENQ